MPPAAHAARYPRAQFNSSAPDAAYRPGGSYASSSTTQQQGHGGGGSGRERGADRGTDEPETRRGRRPFTHRGIFARDVRALMYAYGDAPEADPATVDLLEDLTVDFLTDLCHRARPSPYALPQGPGMRALVPASELTGTGGAGEMMHPAAISAIAAGGSAFFPPTALAFSSSSTTNTSSSSAAAAQQVQIQQQQQQQQQQLYFPLPSTSAGHPFFTRARIKVDDLKHALRKDGKKYARVEELLYLDKVISDARKQMDVGEAAAAVAAAGANAGAGPGAAAGAGGAAGG
ncbi:hypothetical protein OC835_004393 [Tilletia horrida]|uniref:Transcription initiation factor TFIID subunit 13 n=1 Tax=Tilletia horrida TaxID=155126 RepID=A0AAN6JJE9_9BASI|nr:hypothetical protein OC842_004339 [Tilletia horrida]KAK0529264.1 hypothetical protein OC835_004393 [Tilletia horrida]